jgi:glyoxylase-like metal-dependent hydrolase (beta-lactamase superfamily II)
MRNRKAGKIADGLWYLGREEAGVYLLEGRDCSMMINGALSHILPDVLKQMDDFKLDARKIGKFLILHSHFDHAGIVPYFKRQYPRIEVCASEAAWKIFKMPKAIEVMNTFSRLVAEQVHAAEALAGYDTQWRDDVTGTVVSGGDRIDLGGVSVSIIDTPGHTYCSISAYEPVMKALFASDAVGIPYKETIFPSMNTNIDQFQESLEKLKAYPVDYLCADHYGYVTGDEAGKFIELTMVESRKLKKELEDSYHRHGGDVEAAARALNGAFYGENPDYFIAPDIMEGVFKQMVKYIQKSLGPK